MSPPVPIVRRIAHAALIGSMLAAPMVHATGLVVGDTTILAVAVNGGADTVNPGTSCLRISSPVSAACTGGYVAIPNNNRQLVAAALMNKAIASKVMLYYEDAAGTQHCPGLVFTSCAVISIESR